MLPAEDALPVALTLGWPEPLPGSQVRLREIGGTIGAPQLDDDEWITLTSSPVYTVRIDDHAAIEEWFSGEAEGGTLTRHELEVPTSPVLVPPSLLPKRDHLMWVFMTHGVLGRLLWWDEPRTWWMVEEPSLELMLLCAPAGVFRDESDVLSWWDIATDEARKRVDELCARYRITRS